jgi:hypothetical protein
VTAEEVIERLGLQPHPEEGGFFRETYRSGWRFDPPGSPMAGPRSLCTAIYYLLTADTFSAMHRLPGDEIFHFYLGDPVEMLLLHPAREEGGAGRGERILLGQDLERMRVQQRVPGGVWQGSRLVPGGDWALLGTTMSPGFDYDDYESGSRELAEAFPAWSEEIEARLSGDA